MTTEQHYTPVELAKLWKLSANKVRELFAEEAGVIRLGEPSRRKGRGFVRGYFTMRIPQTVADRVYERITSVQ